MSPFRCCRVDEGPVGASGRMARGPVGIEDAPSWLPFECDCGCPLCDAPFVERFEVSLRRCASSTSLCLFSSAMRSRSALVRNFGFVAAASFSRFALSISSMLGGCFFCDAQPFFAFFGCASTGPSSSSGGGGGGGIFAGGGGGGTEPMFAADDLDMLDLGIALQVSFASCRSVAKVQNSRGWQVSACRESWRCDRAKAPPLALPCNHGSVPRQLTSTCTSRAPSPPDIHMCGSTKKLVLVMHLIRPSGNLRLQVLPSSHLNHAGSFMCT